MLRSANNQTLRFGLITDIHFSSEEESAAAMITAADLRSCLECWQRNKIDFLLQLGDLIKGSERYKHEEFHQIDSLLKAYPGIIRHVIGNHCLALDRRELITALGLQNAFYSFTIKSFRFIVLDGMDVSVHRIPESEQDQQILALYGSRPELHDYCGAVGTRQKAWLHGELETAERTGETVMVICHFPLLPETTDNKHGLLWNHREIVELLVSSPAVKVCLSGHFHYGGYACHRDIHFVVLPAFVNRLEHPRFTCGTAELQKDRIVLRNQFDEILYDLHLHHGG